MRTEAVPKTTFDHLRVSLGVTTAVQVTTTKRCEKGVEIKAAIGNTAAIYVGRSDVTSGGTAATDGFPLAAGERIFIPIDDPSDLYLITGTITQNAFVIFV